MKPTDAAATLQVALSADLPAFLWGAPGIGKSDIVRQAAAANNLPLIDLRAVLLDPVDLRGLPTVKDSKAVWLPMGELPDAARDGQDGVLLLDELNAAAPMVQAACFGLVLDRRLGEYRLPSGWRVVAAGNRQSDRASAQRMPSALANRFLHIDVDPDLDGWSQWALRSGIEPVLVAFLRFRPALLHDFQPDRIANPTPRSWAMANRILQSGIAGQAEMLALIGCVGEGAAAELVAFLKVWRSLPSPDAVFLNPTTSPVPDNAATLYAICGALARKVTGQTMPALVTYLSRLPPEFGVMAMKDVTTRDPGLPATPAFIAWASANADIYI